MADSVVKSATSLNLAKRLNPVTHVTEEITVVAALMDSIALHVSETFAMTDINNETCEITCCPNSWCRWNVGIVTCEGCKTTDCRDHAATFIVPTVRKFMMNATAANAALAL